MTTIAIQILTPTELRQLQDAVDELTGEPESSKICVEYQAGNATWFTAWAKAGVHGLNEVAWICVGGAYTPQHLLKVIRQKPH